MHHSQISGLVADPKHVKALAESIAGTPAQRQQFISQLKASFIPAVGVRSLAATLGFIQGSVGAVKFYPTQGLTYPFSPLGLNKSIQKLSEQVGR